MQFRLSRIVPFLLLVSALLASGCIFSPDKKPPKKIPPVVYPLQTSPEFTLDKLVKAYNERDSIATMAVYDTSYTGSSTDPKNVIPPVSLTYRDEIDHVHRLHDDPNIVSVSLDLGPEYSWRREPAKASDPPDWAIINSNFQSVLINLVGGGGSGSTNQIIEFAFKPTVTAPGDTIWRVIRWTEIVQNAKP